MRVLGSDPGGSSLQLPSESPWLLFFLKKKKEKSTGDKTKRLPE
jgi:hypothetical protein